MFFRAFNHCQYIMFCDKNAKKRQRQQSHFSFRVIQIEKKEQLIETMVLIVANLFK